ncbi:hypothetical protein OR62_13915 [Clostridium tetani]|uniref:hypothetical protein n=1 Tax=Clostridium tetani TaxID=1513 RepID=UPI0005743130|nr:hypothetical protein [Clostridium tetani]KHO32065.1 hypothetical protein OR62_13915 [Clostridium tetani]RXI69610.1 hypothetical protein DQN76_07910 [Clostridium tetani]
MDKEVLKLIVNNNLEKLPLTRQEHEAAVKILNTLVIRATEILNFCLKAIQYSSVGNGATKK